MKRKLKILFSILPFLILSACKVGPDYKKPEISINNSWKEDKMVSVANADYHNKWWENFHDPILNHLVDIVLVQNLDLKKSQAKIAEIRASRRIAKSNLFPDATIGAGVERSGQFFPSFGFSTFYNNFDSNVNLSWEVDLFGGKRRELEAASAEFDVAKADRDALQLVIIAELISSYVNYRNLQNRVKINRDIIESQKEILKISQQQFKAGLIDQAGYLSIESELQSRSIDLIIVTALVRELEYEIELIAGKQFGSLKKKLMENKAIPAIKKNLFIENPRDVIASRPDVIAMERRLAAATANQGVATSYKYPKLTISSFIGLRGDSFSDMVSGENKSWSVGGGIVAPLFNFKSIKSNIEVANARERQAFFDYQKIILQALKEVKTSLDSYLFEEEKQQKLQNIANNNKKLLSISQELYKRGSYSNIEVLVSKKQFLESEIKLNNSKADLATKAVKLYKSLGIGASEMQVEKDEN